MEENKRPMVDIDQPTLYNMSSALGLMVRVIEDWDKELFELPHSVHVPTLLVTALLLDKSLGGGLFQAAWISLVEVAAKRKILEGKENEVTWPEWEEGSLRHPELSPVYDISLMLHAWNLAAKQDELPPEMFLGPLFSCAGTVVEGIDRGYFMEDENVKKTYQEQRHMLTEGHGGEEEFKKSLMNQLASIEQTLNSMK